MDEIILTQDAASYLVSLALQASQTDTPAPVTLAFLNKLVTVAGEHSSPHAVTRTALQTVRKTQGTTLLRESYLAWQQPPDAAST